LKTLPAGLPLALCVLLPIIAARSPCASVGETYDQVISEKGKPMSQVQAGSRQILTYPDSVIKVDNGVVKSVTAVTRPSPTPKAAVHAAVTAPSPGNGHPLPNGFLASDVNDARTKLNKALAEAREIINQPMETFPMTPELKEKAGRYPEGWFHPGAEVPNFADPHVERTQNLDDGRYEWITSNLNPDVVFRSADKEFNSQTKFFYVDRTLPKKRLTKDEMAQLDVIYRQIGIYAAYLQRAGFPWTPTPGEP
jgi:hypothetical protein